MDVLNNEVETFPGQIDLGQITAGIALDYLDFRFPQEPWREGRAALAAWHETFAARPSMQQTYPRDPA